jgi:hypothetical protein
MLYFVSEIVPWLLVVAVLTFVFNRVSVVVWPAEKKQKPKPEVYVHPTRLSPCETVAAISIHLRQMNEWELPNYGGRSGVSETLCRQPVGWDNKFGIGEVTCSVCIEKALRLYPEEIMLGNDV